MPTERSVRTFLHPASGALILALDWLLFSGNTLSVGLGTPMLVSIGFILGTLGVTLVQRHYAHESMGKSVLKGLLGGLTVGVPLPVAGTAVGGLVLTLSGLNQWKKRLRAGSSTAEDHKPPRHST